MRDSLKRSLKRFLILLLRCFQWVFIVIVWVLYVLSILAIWIVPYWIILYPVVVLVVRALIKLKHMSYLKRVSGNVIIHGGRRKGKGLLFQYFINMFRSPVLCNIEYGFNSVVLDPETYFNSIQPNTAREFLQNKVKIVPKEDSWEGSPYALDDTALKFPNYEDTLLKKLYPSISLFIPVQGHLYDSFTVLNIQDIERSYKILRELQTDGYIKALSTKGWGYVWSRLPILKNYVFIKWRFHEKLQSALDNVVPFERLGIVSSNNALYTTTPAALKEMYIGQHGEIEDGFIWLKKKDIFFDTRIYHETFFGYKSTAQKKKEEIEEIEEST
jgi:hypothetical protein